MLAQPFLSRIEFISFFLGTSTVPATRPCRRAVTGRRIGILPLPVPSLLPVLGLLLALGLLLIGAAPAPAQDRPLLRISTENTPAHVQTRMIERFVERLRARAGDRLEIEFHHSAALFRDLDVIDALRQGKVEMAVPGTWQLDRYVVEIGVFFLPMLYGRTAAVNHALSDGEIGQRINHALEHTLGAAVLGRWIDLGFTHLYSTGRPIRRHEDLAGMRIRIAGGETNAMRLRALGAEPVIISWPDLPEALQRRVVDGVLTTHATVESARLWRVGLRHAFEDGAFFTQYIPIVAGPFWTRLPPDLQQAMRESWDSIVPEARAEAGRAQDAARAALIGNGISIVTPDTAALDQWRLRIMAGQDALVQSLGMDPALVAQARLRLERLE